MSFSAGVKEELCELSSGARHCQIAELTAILTLCGRIQIDERNHYRLWVYTENISVARKFFTLLKKTFNIESEVSIRTTMNSHTGEQGNGHRIFLYRVLVKHSKDAHKVLQSAKLLDEFGDIREDLSLVSNLVVQQPCCKRAFLRGAFLAAGSVSDPEKGYHLEIVTGAEAKAEQLRELILAFGMEAKVTQRRTGRKTHYLVYLKEGAGLVDLLNVMGAHRALMELENVRILKEMRNSVNRQVNCETANIHKTVTAAARQVEDILYIKDHGGFSSLPEGLEEMARLRLENPEASLVELAGMLDSPIGKSGVNHRLKKLSLIADKLREKKEETRC